MKALNAETQEARRRRETKIKHHFPLRLSASSVSALSAHYVLVGNRMGARPLFIPGVYLQADSKINFINA